VCRFNALAKKDKNRVQAELREVKKKLAVKDDAQGSETNLRFAEE
jgi:hypothetical protein